MFCLFFKKSDQIKFERDLVITGGIKHVYFLWSNVSEGEREREKKKAFQFLARGVRVDLQSEMETKDSFL